MIGTTLAHFKITAKLGEGGMGEVYLAEDTKLGREVAIKVLPEAVASDPERLARFEREAKVLASLNHPNIAAIYSFESFDWAGASPAPTEDNVGEGLAPSHGGDPLSPHAPEPPSPDSPGPRTQAPGPSIHFLVMELVDGDTLQELIAQGVPQEQALEMAAQVAEALEEAHEQGVVHRDLKPANIKVTPNGQVKVLDFGLAKALDLEREGSSPSPTSLSLSPTLTAQMTQAGVLMGTAAYMSPEQARGQEADKRADIWAFGVVVWEMLTQKQLFAGDTVSDTLAEVLKTEPDLALLPDNTPPSVIRLLRRCLTRDPRQRLRDIGDARLELAEADQQETLADRGKGEPAAPPASRWREVLAWTAALLAIGTALFFALRPRPADPESPSIRFDLTLPEGFRLGWGDEPILAFAPDGRSLAFVTIDTETAKQQIYVRALDQVEARPVPGTEGATNPAFSPDGQQLAFFSDGEVRRIPVAGGKSVSLAVAGNPRGVVWSPDGSILYSPGYVAGIWRIPALGGEPELIVEPDAEQGERTYRWPDLLPDGRTVIFSVGSTRSPNNYDDARIDAYSLDSGERWTLIDGANMARFVPPDRLIFARRGTLYAVTLDVDTMSVDGDPVPVVEDLGGDPTSGVSFVAAAPNGSLAYVPGAVTQGKAHLAIVGRDGESTGLMLPPQPLHHPRVSPDGSRIAFTISEGATGISGDVWLYSRDTQALNRFTFGGNDLYPLFTPDGRWITFLRGSGELGIYRKPVDGSGNEELISPPGLDVALPGSWSPDGEILAFTQIGATPDIYLMRPGEEPVLFQKDASSPSFSPDGRWIAYASPGSGNASAFVRPVDGEGKWQVSPGIGSYPTWSGDGRELYYLDIGLPNRPLIKVDIEPGSVFRSGPPVELIADTSRYTTSTAPQKNWDVASSGDEFFFIELDREESTRARIEFLLNWSQQISGENR